MHISEFQVQKNLPICIFIWLISMPMCAQFNNKQSYFLFKLRDSTEILGKITKRIDTTAFLIKTPTFDKIKILKNEILTLEKPDISRIAQAIELDSVFLIQDRYLISQSAFNLKKGDVYFQNLQGYYNSLSIGVSDHFSINIGSALLYFNHLTFKLGGYNLGKDFYFGTTASIILNDAASILTQAFVTKGTKASHFTLGLGHMYTFINNASDFTANFGVATRITKKVSLLTDTWIMPESFIIQAGVRIFSFKKITFDATFGNHPTNHKNLTLLVGACYKF